MNKKDRILKTAPYISLVVILIIASSFVLSMDKPVTAESILKFTPKSPALAFLTLMLFFILKSLSIVFPVSVLYIVSGIIFPPFTAIAVSFAGTFISISITYCIGHFLGKNFEIRLTEKYPKTKKIAAFQKSNSFFAAFITRIVGFLPSDLVGIYFGCCKISFTKYIAGSLLGFSLSFITETLLGSTLSSPTSREFIVILSLRVILAFTSILLNLYLNKKGES